MDQPQTPPDLNQMLLEVRQLTEDNNRLLRQMRKTAMLGLVARVVLWLLVLGVPLFFLSSYLSPLMNAATGTEGQSGILGLPSQDQLDALIQAYQGE